VPKVLETLSMYNQATGALKSLLDFLMLI
jgi:hypothetical protein